MVVKQLFTLILFILSVGSYSQTVIDLRKSGYAKYVVGDNQGAIEDYDKAIKLNPKYAGTYCNRGVAKYAMRDYEGAIRDFTNALDVSPDDEMAFYNRGVAKDELNDFKGALQDYD